MTTTVIDNEAPEECDVCGADLSFLTKDVEFCPSCGERFRTVVEDDDEDDADTEV